MLPEIVRHAFPQFAYSREIPLDNASTTRKPACMMDAISRFCRESYAGTGRGTYRSARQAESDVERCRTAVGQFLGGDGHTVVLFTHGATDGLNMLAESCAQRYLHPGCNVVSTVAEHHSNLLPWMRLCRLHQAELRLARPAVTADAKGHRTVTFRVEDVLKLADAQTALITLTACSNVTGSVLPVAEISRAAHLLGIPVLVDATQLVPHAPMDVGQMGCDALCFSAHKLYGPMGLGVICGNRGFLEHLPPVRLGGGMVETVDAAQMEYALRPLPERFAAGMQPVAEIVGFASSLAFLESIGMEEIARYERTLASCLLDKLAQVEGVRLIHGGAGAAPVVSLVCDFMSSFDLAAMCDAHGMAVRAGKHCAHPFLDDLGEAATVRISPCMYNTPADVDALVRLLWQLKGRSCR